MQTASDIACGKFSILELQCFSHYASSLLYVSCYLLLSSGEEDNSFSANKMQLLNVCYFLFLLEWLRVFSYPGVSPTPIFTTFSLNFILFFLLCNRRGFPSFAHWAVHCACESERKERNWNVCLCITSSLWFLSSFHSSCMTLFVC